MRARHDRDKPGADLTRQRPGAFRAFAPHSNHFAGEVDNEVVDTFRHSSVLRGERCECERSKLLCARAHVLRARRGSQLLRSRCAHLLRSAVEFAEAEPGLLQEHVPPLLPEAVVLCAGPLVLCAALLCAALLCAGRAVVLHARPEVLCARSGFVLCTGRCAELRCSHGSEMLQLITD